MVGPMIYFAVVLGLLGCYIGRRINKCILEDIPLPLFGFFCGFLLGVLISFRVYESPINLHTETNTYILQAMNENGYYSTSPSSKEISVYAETEKGIEKIKINDDNVIFKKTDGTAKVKLTQTTQKFLVLDSEQELRKAVIYLPDISNTVNCEKCGSEISSSDRYCRVCGEKLHELRNALYIRKQG